MLFKDLYTWFQDTKRDLPWRENASPYAVWVSEVMLQQTQVAVVIPYFQRWMQRFPSIKALAHADPSEVLKLWEGLGYYSRARNLHAGAQYILQYFDGKLPNNELKLSEIKGLGPYTVAAIRSFAFKEKAAAIDGNVLRVITRFAGINKDISKATTRKEVHDYVYERLPNEEPWVISEALIELGAQVCKKKAECAFCPLQKNCYSFQHQCTDRLPFKEKKQKISHLHRHVAVLSCKSHLLLKKEEEGKVMSGLYEFPYCNAEEKHLDVFLEELGVKADKAIKLKEYSHSFTRYRVKLSPVLIPLKQEKQITGYQWYSPEEVTQIPFSSGHKKILLDILNSYTD